MEYRVHPGHFLADTEQDADTKKALEQLAEKIRFSDPMSHEQLAELENKIFIDIASLKNTSDKTALISEITLLLNERNKKCKILK